MENDEWRMTNGQWTMDNGQWTMVNGQWTMVNGQWSMDNDICDTFERKFLEFIRNRTFKTVHSTSGHFDTSKTVCPNTAVMPTNGVALGTEVPDSAHGPE